MEKISYILRLFSTIHANDRELDFTIHDINYEGDPLNKLKGKFNVICIHFDRNVTEIAILFVDDWLINLKSWTQIPLQPFLSIYSAISSHSNIHAQPLSIILLKILSGTRQLWVIWISKTESATNKWISFPCLYRPFYKEIPRATNPCIIQ